MRALALFITILICCSLHAQQKRALIVAIGEYPAISRIRPIASGNDVKFIRTALQRNGFGDQYIDTLINEQATKAGILKALDKLVAQSGTGDVIVVHFSCHGQQIRDQATTELGKDEDDGYDEALLPYDARSQYSATGYRGQNHLRDDDLNPVFSALRKKIGTGGSLLVLLDACHSGTGTRSEEFPVSRGEPVPFMDPENPMEGTISINEDDAAALFFKENEGSLANMVVISGTGPHQLNYQLRAGNEDVGSLSYGFYKALQDMPAGSTYRILFERIRAVIQADLPEQLPIAEGNLDQLLFSGHLSQTDQSWFIRVGAPKKAGVTDSLFTLDKGSMDQLAPGNRGKIYRAGTDEWVADAVIRSTGNFNSIGVAGALLSNNTAYEIRMEEGSFGSFTATVDIDKLGATAGERNLRNQFLRWIKPYQFIQTGTAADYQLAVIKENGLNRLALTDRARRTIWWTEPGKGDTMSSDQRRDLLQELKRSMRLNYIRNMPDGGSLAKLVTVSIVPPEGAASAELPELSGGDRYQLKLENKSSARMFYSVIDILPDNNMEILYPFKDKDASNYSIDPGQTITRLLGVSKNPVPGRELLKVIVTREPMDLRAVFARKKERADYNSFQLMLDDLFKDDDRPSATRADIGSVNVEETGIITTGFIVRPGIIK